MIYSSMKYGKFFVIKTINMVICHHYKARYAVKRLGCAVFSTIDNHPDQSLILSISGRLLLWSFSKLLRILSYSHFLGRYDAVTGLFCVHEV